MVKVTYSLDDATVRRIRRTATRLGKAQSLVVREAVADYTARADRLSERERLRLLDTLQRVRALEPARSARAVDAELSALRSARRGNGRGSSTR